jgi:hypothetical protein
MSKNNLPTIVLDFDGVLHSYRSGWKGVSTIPDPPVPGVIGDMLALMENFTVAILSSRSRRWSGRRAMKRWMWQAIEEHFQSTSYEEWPSWLRGPTMDPYEIIINDAARQTMQRLNWPLFKPAALLTIDDRAWCFDGKLPDAQTIRAFCPWYKR